MADQPSVAEDRKQERQAQMWLLLARSREPYPLWLGLPGV